MASLLPEEKFLIFAAVATMFVVGGLFIGGVLYFNNRLNDEQKRVEEMERKKREEQERFERLTRD